MKMNTPCNRSGTDISWPKSPRFVSLTSSSSLVATSFSSCASLSSSNIDDTYKVRSPPQALASLPVGWRKRPDMGEGALGLRTADL